MDIAARIKIFMDHMGMTSSQFADTAGINRSTLSLLFSGRNKKVSDEFITKIHEAYPTLSISWLMFGEGNMETIPNMQFSAPQNSPFESVNQPQQIDNSHINKPQDTFYNSQVFSPENFSMNYRPTSAENNNENFSEKPQKAPITVNFPSAKGKRITNIVVFYDDNSFESFSPA